MSCPVCSQTMQNLGTPDRRVWWCSGCGTLKEETDSFSSVEMPGNLRRIVAAMKKTPCRVSAVFLIERDRGQTPTVKMEAVL